MNPSSLRPAAVRAAPRTRALEDPALATKPLFCAVIEAPFGAIGVRTDQSWVQEVVYLPASFTLQAPRTPVAEQAVRQIERYFEDADFVFSLPLATVGTRFQQGVWDRIATIPRGDVMTYGQLASWIGSAARAVGQACGANWFPLVVPCHRVVAAGGLGGFAHNDDPAGFHLGVKRWLLAHESVTGYA